ncbi:MAG: aspartate aminotransferase family protein [Acidimicrobiia bacterium]
MSTHAEYRELAERVLPGGALGTRLNPEGLRMTIATARGSRITDVEGTEWIDYVCGAGAMILGHQPPDVVEAVQRQAARTFHQYGSLTDIAIELAVRVVDAIPGAERMVFTTTGSEATFYAMRMARAATGKPKILKFEGAFHGNHDYAGVAVSPAEPSPYPRGMPFTDGTPTAVADTMLIAPYNDLGRVRKIVAEHAHELAGIIVEPVQRIIAPAPGFLEGLRAVCDEAGIVLIFDEVVTGFRLAYGGAQEHFGVKADIASYGKIIGGGGPMGAVVGKADLIDQSHPGRKGSQGYVYASGTLHGNPLGAAAGLATLAHLEEPGFYDVMAKRTESLANGLREVLADHGRPAIVETVGSLWQILHMAETPRSYTDLLASDRAANTALDTELMRNGVNVIPGLRRFISSAHTDDDFEMTIAALDRACRTLKGAT